MLALEQVGEGTVNGSFAGLGEFDPHSTTISWVRRTTHEVALDQSIHPVCHRAAGDEGLSAQLTGRQSVWLTGSAKCGQNVELPAVEVVDLESLGASVVEMPRQSSHTGKHRERLDVEVRAFAAPRFDDQIDIVEGLVVGHLDIVDQESRRQES